MKIVGSLAVVALVVGVLVAGWARSSDADRARPAAPQGAPSVSPPATGPRAVPKSEAGLSGATGFGIRYLDQDGRAKTLDVEDFPR